MKIIIKQSTFIPITISLLFILNYFTARDYLTLIGTVLTVAFIFGCELENVVGAVIYFSFFSQIIVFEGLNIFVFIGVAAIIRSCFQDLSRIPRYLLFFIIYVGLHISSTGLKNTTLSFYIPSLLFLTLYACCELVDKNQVDLCIESFLNGYVVSTLAGILAAIGISRISQVIDADFVYHGETSALGMFRFAGIAYDCNFYAVFCILTIGILLFDHYPSYFSSIRRVVTLVFAIVFGMLTISISFYLCFGALLLVKSIHMTKNWLKGTIIAGGIASVLYVAFFSKANYFLTELLSRFGRTDSINSFTSGRTDLWISYWQRYIFDTTSVLFGYGVGNRVIWTAAHNTYLEILYTYGLIGLMCDILMVVLVKYTIFKNNEKSSNYSSILITLTLYIMIFFLSAYTFYSLFTCILITLVIRIKRDDCILTL